ncbi:Na+/proline symporter [Aliiroseovarius halocynthiae]|uniref:histidine kinase n=1 Tax=Aliiroseovarius halocynthiae TaxID=985055 RepID=A0A545SM12_9RHOB|nr:ATP-binding protein [Aliiroseovarius halocynthiae]TQV66015.1 sodium:solute symporter [Aliiroseovarius halocynthiae]SMR83282.1 Na+/proline symporter [Aliiroseovarius halocynthiae]
MLTFNTLVGVCFLYVVLLFLVAFVADKRARRSKVRFLTSPMIYTLSLSVYCTAWTFYGAVGYAARSGLEFVTIYLGPTLVMIGWWWFLRKLVRVGRSQRVTSIADLVSSRYGKSNLLGVLVTLIAVVGTTPYIALQLQSVTLSFAVFARDRSAGWAVPDLEQTAFWVAGGLALFTILFGTRNLDVNERHHGVVTAIAVEAVVKLVALLAVGIFVVWGVGGGPQGIASAMDQVIKAAPEGAWALQGGRWVGLTFLSAAAFLTLPRMFQVLVVENVNERQLAMASWAFPLYLFLMSLFVIPIAVVGLSLMPAGENPDLFVLTLPLYFGRDGLAMLSFLGGFSSATSMVIVASIALATMVSNHIIMPIWLSTRPGGASEYGDVRQILLTARRLSIGGILALGYLYYSISGGGSALAAIGLISFAGVAQVLPAMAGGLFWRGASRGGAVAGLITGFAIWAYTLFLPSFGDAGAMSASMLAHGPWGIEALRPQALFGVDGLDPVVHALFWSLILNCAVFILISLMSFPSPLERLQAAQFVNVLDHSGPARGRSFSAATAEDLLVMAQQIMGADQAQAWFQAQAELQGKQGYLPDTTPDFIGRLERELSGLVGTATAHAMIAQILGGATVSVDDLLAVADETQQMLEQTTQLETKQRELTLTARQLSEVNEKLTQLSIQKDAFLSQISHELRTPMTSIRAFSEILRDGGADDPQAAARHASIIHDESVRLTRLLDDLLDLSVLENGQVQLNPRREVVREVLDRAIAATSSVIDHENMHIHRNRSDEGIALYTDTDRLAQVFINLISNAAKYCDAKEKRLAIRVRQRGGRLQVDFVDNGGGVPLESQSMIFEKFSRLSDHLAAGGAGLGLAICREIMDKLGGEITYLPGQSGAAFRVTLPVGNPSTFARGAEAGVNHL